MYILLSSSPYKKAVFTSSVNKEYSPLAGNANNTLKEFILTIGLNVSW